MAQIETESHLEMTFQTPGGGLVILVGLTATAPTHIEAVLIDGERIPVMGVDIPKRKDPEGGPSIPAGDKLGLLLNAKVDDFPGLDDRAGLPITLIGEA